MKATERRAAIAALLLSETRPTSGDTLSARFGVSRQIIVQDIATLKESGYDILSTNRGYLLQRSPHAERVFKVRHTTEETEEELTRIVSLGGTVADVFVWHRVYGKLQVKLNIRSLSDVREFIEGVRSGKSVELMHITGGYHYHTVRAEDEKTLDKIEAALRDCSVPEIFG